MGKNSSIEWTDHTFNPWWGCAKVSPGCENCYAETWARRVGEKVWGPRQSRRFFGEKHWNEPLRWNSDAESQQRRKRVFCASMADVFELRKDLDPWREQLWRLIGITTWLDWLLLTKRPENIAEQIPWIQDWPKNVWLGTTVENQKYADERVPILLQFPAKCRFLSCEPLLGQVNLSAWTTNRSTKSYGIDWVIAGGESGANARVMLPGWAKSLRDQCQKSDIPFHFKQWGHWAPVADPKNESSRVQRFWDDVMGVEIFMEPKGKKTAGRHLDGATWNQFPVAA